MAANGTEEGGQEDNLLKTVAKIGRDLNLAGYRYEIRSVENKEDVKIKEVCLVGEQGEKILKSEHFQWFQRLAEIQNYARDLANGRTNMLTIERFIKETEEIAKLNPKVKLIKLVGKQLLQEGLNLHHAVGRGSSQEPAAVNLSFMNDPESSEVHAIVGKGLVFDCGGLHVKPFGFMEDMYLDKAGAAAALAVFKGIVEAGLKINITCSLGLAENSIGKDSYRPSDIIRSHKVNFTDRGTYRGSDAH